jgi:ADP-heptose:LPS heptosyltransferase
VFRALQLGDMLLSVPALRALRQHFPAAEITLIGLPWASSFVARYAHYIDRFVEFAGYPGIDEVPLDDGRIAQFLAEQRAYGYDLTIQMHGSGRTSNPFIQALGARMTAGYHEPGTPTSLSYSLPYPDDAHEIERNLRLARLLGCTDASSRLEFPLFENDFADATRLLTSLGLEHTPSPLIALHVGARPPARRWLADSFAAVADALVQRYGAHILLTGSPGEEQTVEPVARQMHMPAFTLVGRTSLGSLAALLTRLDLFISNDTGPSHVACAVDCPSVTIFGPADYGRWRPLDDTHHKTVRHPVACSPCGSWECPIDHRCLRGISPDDVLSVAHSLLTKEIHA